MNPTLASEGGVGPCSGGAGDAGGWRRRRRTVGGARRIKAGVACQRRCRLSRFLRLPFSPLLVEEAVAAFFACSSVETSAWAFGKVVELVASSGRGEVDTWGPGVRGDVFGLQTSLQHSELRMFS